MKGKKHSWQVRRRAFAVWQELGYLPWSKSPEAKKKRRRGDFYKGAFDNIPFLNDDAKRTFAHLLLRPGYMIRDYIRGQHSKYLAPLTALIIFYAFFGLVSSLLKPYQQEPNIPIQADVTFGDGENPDKYAQVTQKTLQIVRRGYVLLHLDEFPEEVDTQRESSLAALESTLRSQGIPLFIGEFILLWLSTSIVLRKQGLGMSACAATSAYILCQFSFFMLFAVLATWGKSDKVGPLLMLLLLFVDYWQLLGVSKRKALSLAIRTGLFYIALFIAVILAASFSAAIIAWFRV